MDHPVVTLHHWVNLPSDIQQEILLRLTINDLLNFAITNKIMMKNINNNCVFWQELFNRRATDSRERNVKNNYSNSEWKSQYRKMFDMALPWTCTLCNGFPIDHFAYKCWHCEDFVCCQPCYERHGHFENHVLLKYYRRMDPACTIGYKFDDRLKYDLVQPSCSKCHVDLQYPTNRSATDKRIYLCDKCVTSEEYSQHRIHRVKVKEMRWPTYENKAIWGCRDCMEVFCAPPGSDEWPYQCVTCRTTLQVDGVICAKCHSTSESMANHHRHKVIPMPPIRSHSGSCDCCNHKPCYIRYKCAVCEYCEYCEYCEEFAPYHYAAQHPMMVFHDQCVSQQIIPIDPTWHKF